MFQTEVSQASFARLGHTFRCDALVRRTLIAVYNNFPEAISSALADTYQRLYELPDPKLPVKYPRTPGYRPAPDDNPYNAW